MKPKMAMDFNPKEVVCQIPVRQEATLIPTTRATRGYQYCGVSTTPRCKGLLLLGYSLFKRP